jgi:hypothetical protein
VLFRLYVVKAVGYSGGRLQRASATMCERSRSLQAFTHRGISPLPDLFLLCLRLCRKTSVLDTSNLL